MDAMTEALREFILSEDLSSEVLCLKWNIDHDIFILRLQRLRKTGMKIREEPDRFRLHKDAYNIMDLQ